MRRHARQPSPLTASSTARADPDVGLLGASVGALNARCDAAALNSAVSNEEVDAKLDAWEEQGARIRKEARRLQREGTAYS